MTLVMAVLACSAPETPAPLEPTVTPYLAPTTPPPSPAPSETETPTSVPPSTWLPANTIALYSAGPWDSRRLYALTADGSSTDMGQSITSWAALSSSGRWIAQPNRPSPADSLLLTTLETGVTYTVPAAAGFDIYGSAFSPDETRLAFLEMGAPEEGGMRWAIVVVNLADLSTARFEAVTGADHTFMPGIPLGWSSAGELLISTFPPYSEWAPLGVWGVTLSAGTPTGPFSALARRELLPGGTYRAAPRFSPDRSRLLHLARDYGYTPASYEPVAYDMAVNQLWVLDLLSGARTLLVEVSDGGALLDDADWSPDGQSILFACGTYAGETFASLQLRIRDSAGGVRAVGALPLPPNGYPGQLNWCRPTLATYTMMSTDGTTSLYLLDLTDGSALLANSANAVTLLGCIP
jgi:hypothetical protein